MEDTYLSPFQLELQLGDMEQGFHLEMNMVDQYQYQLGLCLFEFEEKVALALPVICDIIEHTYNTT